MFFFLIAENCLNLPEKDMLTCLRTDPKINENYSLFYKYAIPDYFKQNPNFPLAKKILEILQEHVDYSLSFALIEIFQNPELIQPYAKDLMASELYNPKLAPALWKGIFLGYSFHDNWIKKAKNELLSFYTETQNLKNHVFHEKFYHLLDEEDQRMFSWIFYLQNHENINIVNYFFKSLKNKGFQDMFALFQKRNSIPGYVLNYSNTRGKVFSYYTEKYSREYLEYCHVKPIQTCPGYGKTVSN